MRALLVTRSFVLISKEMVFEKGFMKNHVKDKESEMDKFIFLQFILGQIHILYKTRAI